MPMAKQMPENIFFYTAVSAIVFLTSCCSMQMFETYLPGNYTAALISHVG